MFDFASAVRPQRIRDMAPDYSIAVQSPLEQFASSRSSSSFPKIEAIQKYLTPAKEAQPSEYFATALQQKIRDKILHYTPKEKSPARASSPLLSYTPIKAPEPVAVTPSPQPRRDLAARMFTSPQLTSGSVTLESA